MLYTPSGSVVNVHESVVAVAVITHVTGVPVPILAEKVTVAPMINELAETVGVLSFVLPSLFSVPVSELAARATEVGVATVIPVVTILRLVNEIASLPNASCTAYTSSAPLGSVYEIVVVAPGTKLRARVITKVFPLAEIEDIATFVPALVTVKSVGSK